MMEEVQIVGTRKDQNNVITHICTGGTPVPKGDAIINIELGFRKYFTRVNGRRAEVFVRSDGGTKYLTTSPDGTTRNNLLDLPDC